MEEQGQRRRRLVLVPCPYQGHITPMLQLGTILSSRGFSITVVHTHFNSPDPSTHPEFEFQSIPDGLSDDDDISSGNIVDLLMRLDMNCRAPFCEHLVQMMINRRRNPAADDDEIIACIIYDELMWFAEAAANQHRLHSIILRTTSAATEISRVALLQLMEDGYIPLQDPSKLRDPVPGLQPLRFKDLPFSRFGLTENYLKFISKMYDVRTSSAVISNTMSCLEQSSLSQLQQQSKIRIFPIGPLHEFAPSSCSGSSLLKEDTSCISWLNNQAPNSVLYISLGSIAAMDTKERVEMAWGLANSRQPFLWVIRPSSNNNNAPDGIELLPEGFEEAVGGNGCIVKWAPQKEVLSHVAVGGFWSHCGWNSTLESICGGVPMICRPSFGDQMVNARYVSHVWRIGLELENHEMERGEIEAAVRKLMVDEEGEEMRQRAKLLKEEIELHVKEDGSSYNSLNRLLELINSF